jgi:hypothetical protein
MHSDERQAAASDLDLLLRYLHEDEVRCPGCLGDLTAMTGSECPTCGQLLELCIEATEPYLRAWVTLTAALALSAGVGFFFGVGSFIVGFPFEPGFEMAAAIFHMVSVPLPICAVLWRRRFIKWSAPMQWLVAAFGAMMVALAFAVLVQSDF